MSEEEAFLQAIQEHPDDEVTRLVFADWLEERGETRAEFVRLDTTLRKMTGKESDFQASEDRWSALRGELPRAWLGAFGHLFTTEELNAAEVGWTQGIPFPDGAELLEFYPTDTICTSDEISMRIVRGSPANVKDGLDFWLRTLHGEMWGPREIPPVGWPPCFAITEASFQKDSAHWITSLLYPPPLPLSRGMKPFIAAVHVSGDWRCQALLAHYRDEFIGLLWQTTA